MTDIDPNARVLEPAVAHWTALRDELAGHQSGAALVSSGRVMDLMEQLRFAEYNLAVMRKAIARGQSLSDAFCALGPVMDIRRRGYTFYSPRRREIPGWENVPDPPVPKRIPGDVPRLEFDGQRWERPSVIHVAWELAIDDCHYDPEPGVDLRSPRHIHASHEINGHGVHIDYIRFMQGGPLSGFDEFQVFVDGAFRNRGGKFVHVPGSFWRGFPVAVRLDDRLLVINAFPPYRDDFAKFDGLSVWRQTTNA